MKLKEVVCILLLLPSFCSFFFFFFSSSFFLLLPFLFPKWQSCILWILRLFELMLSESRGVSQGRREKARMRMQMKHTTTHSGNDQVGKLLQKRTGIWLSTNTGALGNPAIRTWYVLNTCFLVHKLPWQVSLPFCFQEWKRSVPSVPKFTRERTRWETFENSRSSSLSLTRPQKGRKDGLLLS